MYVFQGTTSGQHRGKETPIMTSSENSEIMIFKLIKRQSVREKPHKSDRLRQSSESHEHGHMSEGQIWMS